MHDVAGDIPFENDARPRPRRRGRNTSFTLREPELRLFAFGDCRAN